MSRRIILPGLLLAALAIAWWQGWLQALDVARIGGFVRGAGVFGPVLFVLLMALGNGLGAPGLLFLLVAAALWPAWQAFLLTWAGAIGAGLVGYAFARGIGRSFVERHLPRRLRRLDHHFGARGVRSVAFLRVALFLAAPVHWALGLSSVTPRALLLGSTLGFAPPAAFWTFASAELIAALREGRPAVWLGLLAMSLAALGLTAWIARRTMGEDPAEDPVAEVGPD